MKSPLLLIHGISSTGRVFLIPRKSALGRLLAENFAVTLGELRTGRPEPGQRGWDFDYHLFEDLPRIWNQACEEFGTKPSVLGYSMGGMLASAAQALGIINAPRLVIVAAPHIFPNVPFYPPLMRLALQIAKRTGIRRIPIKLAARVLCLYLLYKRGGAMTPKLALFHLLARKTAADIPWETLKQATSWVSTAKFLNRSGSLDYLTELHKISASTLFLAGEYDRIASPESMKPAFDRISSLRKKFVIVPRADHLSLVGGPHSSEVAKIVEEWFKSMLF